MRPASAILSGDNPRIKRVMNLRKHRDRRESGLFAAEGAREIGRALVAGLRMVELFWSAELTGVGADQLTDRLGVLPAELAPVQVTPTVLGKIAYREKPEGYVALFEQPTWSLERLKIGAAPLFLVVTGIEKPGNLGAMARTSAAAGVTALLVADEQVDAFNPNAIHASTGAVFSLPIISQASGQLIEFLKGRKVRIIAASPDGAKSYTDVNMTGPLAIVIGAEDAGLTQEWRDAADVLVKIPMRTQTVDSLNASNAAAILLFEAVRQRAPRRT
jgi:TrmH family RNA methyltransferase